MNGIVRAVNTVIRVWNGLQFGIPKFSVLGKSFGPWTIGVPDLPTLGEVSIPRLAAGGIVTSPTIALVGEAGPEAVVPLSEFRRGGMMAGTERVQVEIAFAPGMEDLLTAKVNRSNNRRSREEPSYVTDLGRY